MYLVLLSVFKQTKIYHKLIALNEVPAFGALAATYRFVVKICKFPAKENKTSYCAKPLLAVVTIVKFQFLHLVLIRICSLDSELFHLEGLVNYLNNC